MNRLLLGELTRRAPLLPGRDTLTFIDIDSSKTRLWPQETGAAFGHTATAVDPPEAEVGLPGLSRTGNIVRFLCCFPGKIQRQPGIDISIPRA
jgi:hypothetical protein